ncbi:peptidase [Kitasatospora sp. NPDC059795]|uniref:peptidase n=1 Tax=unclassified Kitasatospora TaxID=2633591 RepID=UPI00093BC542|nr:peptidase [Kitasatospora sp. CB01950]OKJ11795.1 peptidase [Kitasatospora sp. CB01950]
MRKLFTLAAPAAALTGLLLLAPAATAASPSPSPSASASGSAKPVVNSVGTSFLTATTLAAGQDADVPVSTGDYLYWAFPASEGQTATVEVKVTLPEAADRHGAQTWTVELFDGLRRRQACTAGPQNGTAEQTATTLALSCTLRQIRAWAEPWSGDPLAGTYYVRLSTSDIPQQDLGLASQVHVHVATKGGVNDAQPEGGSLKAPLVPPVNAGSTATGAATPAPSAGTTYAATPVTEETHWYSDLFSGWNTRWWWTIAGGILAALAGVLGYTLTRHPRGHRPHYHGPQQ